MRNLVFILLALNLLYFLWPKEPEVTRGPYPRGQSNLAMLYALDEVDQRPAASSLVPLSMPQSSMPSSYAATTPTPEAPETPASATTAQAESQPVTEPAAPSAEPVVVAQVAEQAEIAPPVRVEQVIAEKLDGVATVTDLIAASRTASEEQFVKECFTLGPFKDKPAADQALASLKTIAVSASVRTATERRTRGYWVYLPPSKSREAAMKIAEDLASKGFTDYFVVAEGEQDNSISLGLFTLKSGSQRRKQAVKALGYDPKVEVRHTEISVFWIDIEEQKNVQWQAFMNEAFPKGQTERIKRAC